MDISSLAVLKMAPLMVFVEWSINRLVNQSKKWSILNILLSQFPFKQEVDMAIGFLSTNSYRKPFVDYTIPYNPVAITYMMASKYSNHDQNFELSNTDFPLISLIMLISFMISVLIGFITNRAFTHSNSEYAPCWSLFECFIQNGNDESPQFGYQRILTIIWLMAGFITVAATGGQLVSMLAGQAPKPIATLRELAEANHVKIYLASPIIERVLKVGDN